MKQLLEKGVLDVTINRPRLMDVAVPKNGRPLGLAMAFSPEATSPSDCGAGADRQTDRATC